MERAGRDEQESGAGRLRAEERAAVRDDIEARMRDRGVRLTGDESDDQLATLAETVERFEDAIIAIGGDRFVDSADSTEPEHAELVLPPRRDDESPEDYVRRVDEATATIARRREAAGGA